MSDRDYFAALAMQGILAGDKDAITGDVVLRAYAIADAMLEERDQ